MRSAGKGPSVRVVLELRLRGLSKGRKGRGARRSLHLSRRWADLLCRRGRKASAMARKAGCRDEARRWRVRAEGSSSARGGRAAGEGRSAWREAGCRDDEGRRRPSAAARAVRASRASRSTQGRVGRPAWRVLLRKAQIRGIKGRLRVDSKVAEPAGKRAAGQAGQLVDSRGGTIEGDAPRGSAPCRAVARAHRRTSRRRSSSADPDAHAGASRAAREGRAVSRVESA